MLSISLPPWRAIRFKCGEMVCQPRRETRRHEVPIGRYLVIRDQAKENSLNQDFLFIMKTSKNVMKENCLTIMDGLCLLVATTQKASKIPLCPFLYRCTMILFRRLKQLLFKCSKGKLISFDVPQVNSILL